VSAQTIATITATDPSGNSASAQLTVVTQFGLANSAWPKLHQNAQNTSVGVGKGATGTLSWNLNPLGDMSTDIAIGSDGTSYFCTRDGYLCAYKSDGTQKWTYLVGQEIGSKPAIGPDGTIYVVGYAYGNLYAFRPDGSLKWANGLTLTNTTASVGSDCTVYVGTDSALVAVNPDGSIKWSCKTGEATAQLSTPAIGPDGTIFACGVDGKVFAINPDGTQIWVYSSGLYLVGSVPSIGSDGTIYISTPNPPSSCLISISSAGILNWTFALGSFPSNPGIGPDGTIYVCGHSGLLYALNPDGSTKWQISTSGIMHAAPQFNREGMICVGSGNTITAFNTSGVQQWTCPLSSSIWYTGIGPDDTMYAGGDITQDAGAYKLSAVSSVGTLQWQSELGIVISNSPSIGLDGTIYAGASDGGLYAMNPDGTEKWIFQTGGPIYASPTIGADGTVYIGSADNFIYAVNEAGVLKWKFKTKGAVESSVALRSSIVYVGSFDQTLYAVNLDGSLKWACQTEGPIGSAPALGADGTIYVGVGIGNSGSGYLDAVSPSGKENWSVSLGAPWNLYLVTSGMDPVVEPSGGITISNGGTLFAISPEGVTRWTYGTGQFPAASPAVGTDGTIYVALVGNALTALNPDGTTKWSYEAPGFYPTAVSIGADGTIYTGEENAWAFSPAGVPEWESPFLIGLSGVPPAIGADGTLYFGGFGLYAIK
jgi:outer membrane protein assembly factor BamB